MNKSIGWELYRSFLGVMKAGSLSAAARTLGISQPTVGRHVAELERALEVVLFIRNQSGLVPTDAAQALLIPAREMANIAESTARIATNQSDKVQGTVRVTASDVLGIEILPRIFAKLAEQYPELQLELVLSDRVQDLLNREADIAIRMFRPTQDSLIARHIGTTDAGFYAHKRYLEKAGEPNSLDELADHSLIGFDQVTDFIRHATKSFPFQIDKKLFTFRADSNVAQLELVRAGAGIGMCQTRLVSRDANLVRVLPDAFSFDMEVWLAMHEDLRRSPACLAVFNGLAEGLVQYIEQR